MHLCMWFSCERAFGRIMIYVPLMCTEIALRLYTRYRKCASAASEKETGEGQSLIRSVIRLYKAVRFTFYRDLGGPRAAGEECDGGGGGVSRDALFQSFELKLTLALALGDSALTRQDD